MNSNGFTATRNLVRVTLIAGTLLAPVCAPSFAAEEGTVPATTVKYEDLNLATRQGAEVLYRRITAAAYEVCWPQSHGDFRGEVAVRKCVHSAMDDAVAKVNNPLVKAIHEHSPLPAVLATAPSQRE